MQARDVNENWAQAWIDEQRRNCERMAEERARSNVDTEVDVAALFSGFGREWLNVAERWLRAGFSAGAPPIGWAREHQLAWRELVDAQLAYRKCETDWLARLVAIHAQALDRLERVVRARAQENRPLEDVRELYDLWIECAEDVYAEVARSDEYAQLQGALINAAVQWRAKQQIVLERVLKQFDLPTRAELNSVHRELRALRRRLDRIEQGVVARDRTKKSTAQSASTKKRRRA
ncbi:MAG: poly(R)-hydroxyalkanoic acid synthase subunit PhaE [Gammaproteobacteria bacterium]|nr:hypothetical protein [Gammaproteobacteria bacterium]